jgi:hypothetical protein
VAGNKPLQIIDDRVHALGEGSKPEKFQFFGDAVLVQIPGADYVRGFSNEKEVAMSGGGKG